MENSRSVKILLVDDEPDNTLLLENVLKKPNRDIFQAHSGYEACDLISNHEFALALLDVQMPEMDGFQTASLIRKTETNRQLPIIFVTANHRAQQNVFQGYESGAVDYLFKPIQPNIVRHKVDIFVELYQGKQLYVEKSIALEKALLDQQKISEDLRQKTDQLHETQRQLEYANHHLRHLNNQMVRDLKQAHKTQNALLPKNFANLPGAEMAAKYMPMQLIGGDFYDLFELSQNKFAILLVDVTGHDTSAALVSFMVAGIFKTFAFDNEGIVPMIEQINTSLYNSLPGHRFATVFYCIYDAHSRLLEYASFGHPEGYVIRARDQKIDRLYCGGPPLGVFSNEQGQFEAGTIQLHQGDKVYLYTDGILELKNAQRDMFGKQRMKEFLKNHSQLPIQDLLEASIYHVLKFGNKMQFEDDITLIGLDIK